VPPAVQRPTSTPTPEPPRRSWATWIALAALLGALYWWQSHASDTAHPEVAYSTVYKWIRDGKVKSVEIRGDSLEGTLASPEVDNGQKVTTFHTLAPDDKNLVPTLEDKNVEIHVASPESPMLLRLLVGLLPWILIIGVWMWLSRRAQSMMVAGGGPFGGFLKRGRKVEKAKATVTFADVAGLVAAKRDLEEIVSFLKEPERFERLGANIPRGVLLVGPPGTGKTLLARAVAGEADAPFYTISASEFVEMFVGVGAARVRELFTEAKRNAPSIVFIDELDGVGRSRGTGLGGSHD